MPPSGLIEKDAEFVFDASVALRALIAREEAALSWIRRVQWGEIVGNWPELVYIEIASGLRTQVHTKSWTKSQAYEAMARAMEFPMQTTPVAALVPAALEVALARRLTPYDACYAILAELLGATLVTADRRLAAAVPNAVMV